MSECGTDVACRGGWVQSVCKFYEEEFRNTSVRPIHCVGNLRFRFRAYLTEFLPVGSVTVLWITIPPAAISPASHGSKCVDCMQNTKTRREVFTLLHKWKKVALIVCIWFQVLQYFKKTRNIWWHGPGRSISRAYILKRQ